MSNEYGLSQFDHEMRKFEAALVRGILIQAAGNICQAARLAGMHRNTFGRKVYAHKIDIRECRRIAKQQRQSVC